MLVQSIVRYLGAALGREGALAALAEAVDPAALSDSKRWFTVRETIAIANAASAATGDDQIGRRAGDQLFRDACASGIDDFIIASGSVEAAMTGVCHWAMTMSPDRVLEVVETGPRHLVVSARTTEGRGLPHRFFCDLSLGYYANIPSLFGLVGHTTEASCEQRGDGQCLYRLAWTRPARLASTTDKPSADVATSALRRDRRLSRFEEMQEAAADIVSADSVQVALERITRRVGTALHAPRYLLAVRLTDDAPELVHHFGFGSEDDALGCAKGLADAYHRDTPGTMVAEVRSARRHYGYIAALFAPGSSRSTEAWVQQQRLIDAYATHAAAALEVVSSLESARRDRDTATALLDLARELARATGSGDIAQLLAPTVCRVVNADVAAVWLWDASGRRLVLASHAAAGDETVELPSELSVDDVPSLEAVAMAPGPVLLQTNEVPGDHAVVLELCQHLGLATTAIVPITGRGGYVGMVAAGFRRRVTRGAEAASLINRLDGLAHHAAVAYENAELVDQLRHLALHDSLTGLANRPLVRDRFELAMRSSERAETRPALLYIDLDRFKGVNDSMGHAAGDALLVHVARRLERVLRPGDTLGRLGGDEFIVVLPSVRGESDARAVAARLIDAMSFPFIVDNRRVDMSCSVGIALASDGDTYESLTAKADASMYATKLSRGHFTNAG